MSQQQRQPPPPSSSALGPNRVLHYSLVQRIHALKTLATYSYHLAQEVLLEKFRFWHFLYTSNDFLPWSTYSDRDQRGAFCTCCVAFFNVLEKPLRESSLDRWLRLWGKPGMSCPPFPPTHPILRDEIEAWKSTPFWSSNIRMNDSAFGLLASTHTAMTFIYHSFLQFPNYPLRNNPGIIWPSATAIDGFQSILDIFLHINHIVPFNSYTLPDLFLQTSVSCRFPHFN